MPRGIALGLLGGIVLLGTALAPLLAGPYLTKDAARHLQKLGLVGCLLLVGARRYFQVSADALLAADHRKPILFLRSFADDQQAPGEPRNYRQLSATQGHGSRSRAAGRSESRVACAPSRGRRAIISCAREEGGRDIAGLFSRDPIGQSLHVLRSVHSGGISERTRSHDRGGPRRSSG